MPVALLSGPRARGKREERRDSMADPPRTADFAWSVLARMFFVAKDRGHITVNPCEGGGGLYPSDRVDCIWTEERLDGLFAACSDEVHDVVVLASWTGRRQGRPSAPDLACRRRPAYPAAPGEGGRARGDVPTGPTLRAMLDQIPRAASTQIPTSSHGTPWTSDGFRTRVRRRGGVTLHHLRGTAVTRLSIAGCTPQQIAAITGHGLPTANQVLDAHHTSRDVALAEDVIRLLEREKPEHRL